MEETLSIIIPHYNQEIYLESCLDSLLKSELPGNWEIIVVHNDESFSASLKSVIKKFAANVVFLTEKQPGSYAARNRGVAYSKGNYLCFLDADCRVAENWLEILKKNLSKLEILAGKVSLNSSINPNVYEVYDDIFYFNQEITVKKDLYAVTAHLIVRRDIFQHCGPFKAALLSGGDWEWSRRATLAGYLISYSDELVVFHNARSTFKDQLTRNIRVFTGGVYLHCIEGGSINFSYLSQMFKAFFLPSKLRGWSIDRQKFEELSKLMKVRLVLLVYFFHFIYFSILILGFFDFSWIKKFRMIERKDSCGAQGPR
jgi:glycosyltransferase involved in cell wall biosynthesis